MLRLSYSVSSECLIGRLFVLNKYCQFLFTHSSFDWDGNMNDGHTGAFGIGKARLVENKWSGEDHVQEERALFYSS